ncbi:MAG: MBL fold metallo-hydrolase [Calditerrivibrio sp.]|nr:MBL fold metallo-hydrolase [Calditerrivibrio sp.]MCA1932600.1 MBL fold metallo-hydrolase [Calditerrivibrio sp.]MCA1980313.1 MBL fold metallo-hydrolase [Calditerrivibrio sp.]
MGIKVAVLASGSSGNSYFVEDNEVSFFVDAGVGKRTIADISKKVGDKPCYLFLTHSHSDHVKGLKYFLKTFNLTVFCSMPTARDLYENGNDIDNIKILDDKIRYLFNNFSVFPFKVNHDCDGTFGYRFSFKNGEISFVTDTGIIDKTILDSIDGSNAIFLESNYDEDMLKNGRYPLHLKKRILSKNGHLSNKDAIKTLHEIYGQKLKKVFFSHISEENNSYDLIDKYCRYVEKTLKMEAFTLRQKSYYNFSLF